MFESAVLSVAEQLNVTDFDFRMAEFAGDERETVGDVVSFAGVALPVEKAYVSLFPAGSVAFILR